MIAQTYGNNLQACEKAGATIPRFWYDCFCSKRLRHLADQVPLPVVIMTGPVLYRYLYEPETNDSAQTGDSGQLSDVLGRGFTGPTKASGIMCYAGYVRAFAELA